MGYRLLYQFRLILNGNDLKRIGLKLIGKMLKVLVDSQMSVIDGSIITSY